MNLTSLGIEPSSSFQPFYSTAKKVLHSRADDPSVPDLITVEAVLARSALAELNTHRVFSRNSASSRAIPIKRMLEDVVNKPYIPSRYSKAQKGMHASEFVSFSDDYDAWEETTLGWWLPSRDRAVQGALEGLERGLHKQDVNRILEPFLTHTVLITSTEWDNFIAQRTAEDENGNPLPYLPIYELGVAIRDLVDTEPDQILEHGEWHTPLMGQPGDERLTPAARCEVSTARSARVSYLTHEGVRDIVADLSLYGRLVNGSHWSPFEHVATPNPFNSAGNFVGWTQFRALIEKG